MKKRRNREIKGLAFFLHFLLKERYSRQLALSLQERKLLPVTGLLVTVSLRRQASRYIFSFFLQASYRTSVYSNQGKDFSEVRHFADADLNLDLHVSPKNSV